MHAQVEEASHAGSQASRLDRRARRVALGIAAAGSSGGSSAQLWLAQPGRHGQHRIGEPQHLLPSNSIDSNADQVLVGLFTPLVTYRQRESMPVLDQAQSITTTDGKVWDIKIKPGYTFSQR